MFMNHMLTAISKLIINLLTKLIMSLDLLNSLFLALTKAFATVKQ